MSLTRVLEKASRTALAQCRSLFFSPPLHHHNHSFSLLCNHFHSLSDVSRKASPLHNGLHSIVSFPHCGMATFASPEQEQGTHAEKKGDNGSVDAAKQGDEAVSADNEASAQTEETDSEEDMDDLSREDLGKVIEKKQKEFDAWKENMIRCYAEMENVMERTRRDAENSKKFAVQSFAKSLLDVADNLGRASSVTKESFSKLDASEDTVGATPLLKTLLEGVELTEKQLAEVFRKAGIEKYDPTNEQFDPNRHNAVFQVPDNSKSPGTVAVVLKAGYTLHDRIIRPAEVGVTVAVENNEADS